jgi:hypothetical protein
MAEETDYTGATAPPDAAAVAPAPGEPPPLPPTAMALAGKAKDLQASRQARQLAFRRDRVTPKVTIPRRTLSLRRIS